MSVDAFKSVSSNRSGQHIMAKNPKHFFTLSLGTTLVLLAACGPSAPARSTNWTGLSSVSVTVSRPLPPPSGGPTTTRYSTPGELATVTAALHRNHIGEGEVGGNTAGCVGGATVTITIVSAKSGLAPTHLSGYTCAGRQSGNITGNLQGLLSQLQL